VTSSGRSCLKVGSWRKKRTVASSDDYHRGWLQVKGSVTLLFNPVATSASIFKSKLCETTSHALSSLAYLELPLSAWLWLDPLAPHWADSKSSTFQIYWPQENLMVRLGV
jgi:hypothetical protein